MSAAESFTAAGAESAEFVPGFGMNFWYDLCARCVFGSESSPLRKDCNYLFD